MMSISSYRCCRSLDLYDDETLARLATQATAGRYLTLTEEVTATARRVVLQEDAYPGWITLTDLANLRPVEQPYQPVALGRPAVVERWPQVLAFLNQAQAQPNVYLWGGTVGPNFDCSGLVQTAFAQAGIWLPRDAYQQEAFAMPLGPGTPDTLPLEPGDLLFFGAAGRATHVGIYLGAGHFLHSSGPERGHNGIALDSLGSGCTDVATRYLQAWRGAGRIMASYDGRPLFRS
ncbi:MAG: C40 family peptidase [Gloeomargaritaceae cyanobacterium C42_A2020_066]|nr:C40 family peptidase [Gloeomargaritaceae cyanobacterium C42_A2020_066]